MLHIIYRYCNKENNKPRPVFYSKEICLKSLIVALEGLSDFTFSFIGDGVINERLQILVNTFAKIEILPEVGNTTSFLYALSKVWQIPDDDIVYFVEDDYLHLPEALVKLLDCFGSVNADYVTLYDHPVRYIKNDQVADLPLYNHAIFTSHLHHWWNVESTCMTFAAKSATIKADFAIFQQHTDNHLTPNDREIFRHLQGLGLYADKNTSPMRILVGPIPSLATHCEEPWLAPVVDWLSQATDVAKSTIVGVNVP